MSKIKDITEEAMPKSALTADAKADMELARAKLKLSDADEAMKRYRALLKERAAEQRIIDEFAAVLGDVLADGRLRIQIESPLKRAGKPRRKSHEDAMLVISDPHVGKRVKLSHTIGFGHYNLKVFFNELHHLEQTVARLLTQNIDNPVDTLHVPFLGDIVEGMLNHAQEIPQREYVADQVIIAAWAFYQFLARLSRVVPKIICRGISGNHARWGTQRKPPTEGRYSNYDFIVYGMIQALLKFGGPANVEFRLEEGSFQVFDVQGWRFKIGHGDHLKGGDRALGIPAHAIGREINATTQRYAACGQRPPDYYIVGDKHRHMSVQTARGRYMVNGAWFEADDFALSANFTPGLPHQMFFGVHPRFGKSWSYDITFAHVPDVPLKYDLPGRLAEKVRDDDLKPGAGNGCDPAPKDFFGHS